MMTNRNGSKPVCMKNRTPGDRGNSRPMMSNGIEFLDLTGIGDFCHGALNTGVVERRIQPPEGRNRLLYHGFYLRVISHVALYADGFVTGGDQLFGGRASRS